jgi:hypothetical protein
VGTRTERLSFEWSGGGEAADLAAGSALKYAHAILGDGRPKGHYLKSTVVLSRTKYY